MTRYLPSLRVAVILTTFSIMSISDAARANWPIVRHDTARTAAASGTSDINDPVAYWRTYLGGSISDLQFISYDVDGDGNLELVFSAGGRIVAKKPEGTLVWQTAARNFGGIIAITDIDGDGENDIVTNNSNHAYILSAKTGNTEWIETDGEMGDLGAIRVGDVNGDGLADLAIEEAICGATPSGNRGYIYSFAQGFQTPTKLWTMPIAACSGQYSATLVDVTGDGRYDVMLGAENHFELFDGRNGNLLGISPNLPEWTQTSRCQTKNIDGIPGDEIICALNVPNQPAINQHNVSVLKYNPVGHSLDLLWWHVVAPNADGNVSYGNLVTDLDGDQVYEVIVSGYDNTHGWTAYVFDALTGTTLATQAGYKVLGSLESDTAGQEVLITSVGANLVAWNFTRAPQAALTQAWTLTDQEVMQVNLRDGNARYSASLGIVAADLNGDGLLDITTKVHSSSSGIAAYATAGGSPQLLGTRQLPSNVSPGQVWMLSSLTSANPLALYRSDGLLEVLNKQLNVARVNIGEFSLPLVVEIGGYYASGAWRALANGPRTYPLASNAADSIIAVDSRGSLLRFDPQEASWAASPVATWSKPQTMWPAIVPSLDGATPGIACYSWATGEYQIAALHADGTTIWSVPLGNPTLQSVAIPFVDPTPAQLNNDATPDLVVQWGNPSDTLLYTSAISGSDGSRLWNPEPNPLIPGWGRQPAGVTIGQWNGTTTDDIFYQATGTRVLDGEDGHLLANAATSYEYSLPIMYDTNGDGSDEFVLGGGYHPVRLYAHNLQSPPLWASSDDDRPYPYGAIAACAGGVVLVEGSLRYSARLKLTQLSGTTAEGLGNYKTFVLAGGQLFANETAAQTAGMWLGQLTSAAVHSNLSGLGRPTALVGSTDGFLYAFDPCSCLENPFAPSLDFAVDFNAAVGEIVFGDTDLDQRDEIIVSVADGYLYDFKNKNIDQPTDVIDTDPDHGKPNVDVNYVETVDKLSGAWSSVGGATGYAVAISDGAKLISQPAWQDVGLATTASITGLPLVVGERYFFVVRALSSAGPSVDSLSNGVTIGAVSDASVTDDALDASSDGSTPPPGGNGCGCSLTASAQAKPTITILAGLLLLVLLRARRRMTSSC